MTVDTNHIRVRRMWNYVHKHKEITLEEHAHALSCKACSYMFRMCILADDPAKVKFDQNDDDDKGMKQSA